MIRTRDFVVYIGVLLFLVSAISVTITKDLIVARTATVEQFAAVSASAQELSLGVVAATDTEDRATYIAAMREKLARGEGKISGAPVVLASEISTPSPAEPVTSRSVMLCSASASMDRVLMNWEPSSTVIRTVEGARVVVHEVPGQEGEAEATAEPLLQLAMRHARAAHDSCLPSQVVGVGVDGTLILNGDAPRFQSMVHDRLIGYALDGFPIYGVAPGDTLDSCGGTDTGAGYQYHIRADEDFVLGCFAAAPAQFLN